MNRDMAIARSIAWTMKNYGRFVEREDLRQMTDIYILEHEAKLLELDELEAKLADWVLFKELNKMLGRYARREKAQQSSYQAEDEVFYELKRIAGFLPAVMDDDREPPVTEPSEVQATTDPAHRGEWFAGWMDVARAWREAELSQSERDVMLALYHDGVSQESVSAMLGVSQQSIGRTHKRVLEKLQAILGGPDPGISCAEGCECHSAPATVEL